MLGVQSIWTLYSGEFVEKMCKIRVKYVIFNEIRENTYKNPYTASVDII